MGRVGHDGVLGNRVKEEGEGGGEREGARREKRGKRGEKGERGERKGKKTVQVLGLTLRRSMLTKPNA